MDDDHEPMSETMFCILFSLRQERHGYGVMQHVHELTGGRVAPGAGTTYTTLRRLERQGLITATGEVDRRKNYVLSDAGLRALTAEARRIAALHDLGRDLL